MIGSLQIQRWCFGCNRLSGWIIAALAILEWLGEPFCTNWNHLCTPELRNVTCIDCDILLPHIEKDCSQKSWVKTDQRLMRHCNSTGRGPSCTCPTQHNTLNDSSDALHVNPGTDWESLWLNFDSCFGSSLGFCTHKLSPPSMPPLCIVG